MDYLREGIHLRGFAQIDPLVAYKNEGYTMFQELMDSIWEEFARLIFHVEVNIEPTQVEELSVPTSQPCATSTTRAAPRRSSPRRSREARAAAVAGTATAPAAAAAAGAGAATGGNGSANGGTNPATVVKAEDEKIGRNDPCWCGSGQEVQEVPRRLTGRDTPARRHRSARGLEATSPSSSLI